MTLDDLLAREAIRHTLTSYNKAGDADDPDGFAACFTKDGLIDAPSFHHERRENIRAWKTSNQVFSQGISGASAAFRVHHISSIHIDLLSSERAKTRTTWLVVTDIGPDHSGVYHDVFRRDGARWLIEERVIDCLWRAERSYIAPETVNRRADGTPDRHRIGTP